MSVLVYLPAVVVSLALLLVLPLWPWSRGWGYVPAAMVAVVLASIGLFTLAFVPA